MSHRFVRRLLLLGANPCRLVTQNEVVEAQMSRSHFARAALRRRLDSLRG